MLGTITLTRRNEVPIHTYTSPEAGWLVNTHIIELPTQLLVVDAQYTLTFASEVVRYAETLEKPITRVYISHFHPDHLLGAAAFSAPLYALAEVIAKIDAVGDRVASEEHEKHLRLQLAETENALMIALPDHGILIAQDFLYHGVHVFLGERAFDTWIQMLQEFKMLPYDLLLAGHGTSGGPEIYDQMIQYLSFAKEALAKSSSGEDLKERLIAGFPNFGGRVLLDHQQRFLFPTHMGGVQSKTDR
jgi:glyoxylase-like metal-dependent hydrolase (beta-lactamase superfamily II)